MKPTIRELSVEERFSLINIIAFVSAPRISSNPVISTLNQYIERKYAATDRIEGTITELHKHFSTIGIPTHTDCPYPLQQCLDDYMRVGTPRVDIARISGDNRLQTSTVEMADTVLDMALERCFSRISGFIDEDHLDVKFILKRPDGEVTLRANDVFLVHPFSKKIYAFFNLEQFRAIK